MADLTRRLWAKQDQHPGDQERLFRAVAGHVETRSVLYPGSYVDLAASFVWPEVTYVDVDRRARQFFADAAEVDAIIAEHGTDPADRSWRFVPGDFTEDLPVEDAAYDLLVSLYAGHISAACTRHLRIGGMLLVNSSHGDVAMAHLDERYELAAVVEKAGEDYRVRSTGLESYLIPKKPDVEITRELLRQSGRGVAYTRSPSAYLFERVR